MSTNENLEEIREKIDLLDKNIIKLLAARSHYVKKAAKFKTSVDDVEAPKRVEQVIAKVREMAECHGLEPEIAENTYRALIKCFIDYEMKEMSSS